MNNETQTQDEIENENVINNFYNRIRHLIDIQNHTFESIFHCENLPVISLIQFQECLFTSLNYSPSDNSHEINIISFKFKSNFDEDKISINILRQLYEKYVKQEEEKENNLILVKVKLQQCENTILNKLNSSEEQILYNVYNKFNDFINNNPDREKFIKESFQLKENENNGVLHYDAYIEVINLLVSLKNNEKLILFVNHKQTQVTFNYLSFLKRLKTFKEDNSEWKLKGRFGVIYNIYIDQMRKYFEEKELRNVWALSLDNKNKINNEEFFNFICKNRIFENSFSKLESDFVFDKLIDYIKAHFNSESKENNSANQYLLTFKGFEHIINISKDKNIDNEIDKAYLNVQLNNIYNNKRNTHNKDKFFLGLNKLVRGLRVREEENEETEIKNNKYKVSPNYFDQHEEIEYENDNKPKIILYSFFSCDAYPELNDNIKERINSINQKIKYIVNQHKQYLIINEYYNLYDIITKNNLTNKLRNSFENKAQLYNGCKLPYDTFSSILKENEIICHNLLLILNSLYDYSNKPNRQKEYNYNEFLKNINNIIYTHPLTAKQIVSETQMYFNDYLVYIKKYIQEHYINYEKEYTSILKGKQHIDLYSFKLFCEKINLSMNLEIEEYKFIFYTLCQYYNQDNNTDYLHKNDLFNFFQQKPISLEQFLSNGDTELVLSEHQKYFTWNKQIPTYNEINSVYYKNNYSYLAEIFEIINKSLQEKEIADITEYCCDNINDVFDITINGIIKTNVFISILLSLGITNKKDIQLLTMSFKYNNNEFNLALFLSIYFLFYPKPQNDDNESSILPNTSQINAFYDKLIGPEVKVYQNKNREFTQKEIDIIAEISQYITDIIVNEKKMETKKYFMNYNKDKSGYISLETFIMLLEDDLFIEVKDAIDMFEVFFDFVCETNLDNKKIIPLKRLVKMMDVYANIRKEEDVGKRVVGEIKKNILSAAIQTST